MASTNFSRISFFPANILYSSTHDAPSPVVNGSSSLSLSFSPLSLSGSHFRSIDPASSTRAVFHRGNLLSLSIHPSIYLSISLPLTLPLRVAHYASWKKHVERFFRTRVPHTTTLVKRSFAAAPHRIHACIHPPPCGTRTRADRHDSFRHDILEFSTKFEDEETVSCRSSNRRATVVASIVASSPRGEDTGHSPFSPRSPRFFRSFYTPCSRSLRPS